MAHLNCRPSLYDLLLPALGFRRAIPRRPSKVSARTEPLPSTAHFGVTEERGHVANSNRIAFWVPTDAEVDRVTELALEAGAMNVSGPKSMPYSPGYYASFFADPSGNLLEIDVRPE